MRIINAKSREVAALTHRKRVEVGISINERQIYFPKSLCLTQNFREGQYVHFLNDGEDWRFFVNEDKDGFKFLKYKNPGALLIASSGLCNMILKSTKCEAGVIFPVEPTIYEQGGKKVFWILTKRRIKKIERKKIVP